MEPHKGRERPGESVCVREREALPFFLKFRDHLLKTAMPWYFSMVEIIKQGVTYSLVNQINQGPKIVIHPVDMRGSHPRGLTNSGLSCFNLYEPIIVKKRLFDSLMKKRQNLIWCLYT